MLKRIYIYIYKKHKLCTFSMHSFVGNPRLKLASRMAPLLIIADQEWGRLIWGPRWGRQLLAGRLHARNLPPLLKHHFYTITYTITHTHLVLYKFAIMQINVSKLSTDRKSIRLECRVLPRRPVELTGSMLASRLVDFVFAS